MSEDKYGGTYDDPAAAAAAAALGWEPLQPFSGEAGSADGSTGNVLGGGWSSDGGSIYLSGSGSASSVQEGYDQNGNWIGYSSSGGSYADSDEYDPYEGPNFAPLISGVTEGSYLAVDQSYAGGAEVGPSTSGPTITDTNVSS